MHGAAGPSHRSLPGSERVLTLLGLAPPAGDLDQRSAGLTINLSSNNPFRNRTVSPSFPPQSPVSPFDDPPPRPVSRNPFLDPTVTGRSSLQNLRSTSEAMSLDKRPSLTADEIFGSLTLEDQKSPPAIPPKPDGGRPAPAPGRRGPPPPGRDNMPPPGRRGPPPNHRPTRSQEEALRARRAQQKPDSAAPVDLLSRSPQRRSDRPRPRRNSDTSVMEADKDEEKRQQERRERERRQRSANKPKKGVSMDPIDLLDSTGIFGTPYYHHDGPFDALNPRRNKQGSRRAPMQAFPEGSLNNTLGGAGPLNSRPDHAMFLGQQGNEAFEEWSKGAKDGGLSKTEAPVFDPLSRGSVLHGDESMGLGTSTFLEGTPAARTAIQKREEEQRSAEVDGLQRKKSLAHRIRNINRGPREFQPSGRITNPDAPYMSRRSPSEGGPASAGPLSGNSERNPFFSEYGSGKGGEEEFTVRKMDSNANRVSPTSPKPYGLERRSTADGSNSDEVQAKPTGLLGRMKSLKGGRRGPPLPPRDVGAPAPGTAV